MRSLLVFLTIAFESAQAGDIVNSSDRVVRLLYRDYAWEVLFAKSDFVELIDQSSEELSKYFAPRLVELLEKDRICRGKTGDACHLDFDPIYASQDRGSVNSLSINLTHDGSGVNVRFRQSALMLSELTFKVVLTASGWRVDDILYKDKKTSLVDILVGAAK